MLYILQTIQLQAQVTALGEFNDFAFAETKVRLI